MLSLTVFLFLDYETEGEKKKKKALNLSTVLQVLHIFTMSPLSHLSKENPQPLNFLTRAIPDSL